MAGVKERSGKSYDEYDYLMAMAIADANNFLMIDEDVYLATSAVSPENVIIKKDAWQKMSRHARDMASVLIRDESEFNIFTRCHDPKYCDPKDYKNHKYTIKKYGRNLDKRQKNHHVIAKFFSIRWNKSLPFVRRRIREIVEFCEVL